MILIVKQISYKKPSTFRPVNMYVSKHINLGWIRDANTVLMESRIELQSRIRYIDFTFLLSHLTPIHCFTIIFLALSQKTTKSAYTQTRSGSDNSLRYWLNRDRTRREKLINCSLILRSITFIRTILIYPYIIYLRITMLPEFYLLLLSNDYRFYRLLSYVATRCYFFILISATATSCFYINFEI